MELSPSDKILRTLTRETSNINTFSINFVPPPSDKLDIEYDRNENVRIMETSKNGKLTYPDVEKQTKHKNKYVKTMANSDTSLKTGQT